MSLEIDKTFLTNFLKIIVDIMGLNIENNVVQVATHHAKVAASGSCAKSFNNDSADC